MAANERFGIFSKRWRTRTKILGALAFSTPDEHITYHTTLLDAMPSGAFSKQGIIHTTPRNITGYNSCIEGQLVCLDGLM